MIILRAKGTPIRKLRMTYGHVSIRRPEVSVALGLHVFVQVVSTVTEG